MSFLLNSTSAAKAGLRMSKVCFMGLQRVTIEGDIRATISLILELLLVLSLS